MHEAVVAELAELFDADAGGAQHLDDRPRPERLFFFDADVTASGAQRVLGPDARPFTPDRCRACDGEALAGTCPTDTGRQMML